MCFEAKFFSTKKDVYSHTSFSNILKPLVFH